MRNGKPEATGKTDDPIGALAWLANLAVKRGRPMTAGMAVITGSVVATVDIAPGERFDFALDGIGDIHDGDLSPVADKVHQISACMLSVDRVLRARTSAVCG